MNRVSTGRSSQLSQINHQPNVDPSVLSLLRGTQDRSHVLNGRGTRTHYPIPMVWLDRKS